MFWGILLRLDWELLREGRLKIARGRSWRPEIGMEHASRGRRSGNKGVGARWRGRFRIFSARHCSRTKVSHAENSGMTMLFFSLGIAPVSGGVGAGARGGFNPLRGATTGVVMRRRATTGEGVKEFPQDSDGKASPPCGGDSGMTMVWVLLPFVLRAVAQASARRWSVHTLRIAGGPAIRGVRRVAGRCCRLC